MVFRVLDGYPVRAETSLRFPLWAGGYGRTTTAEERPDPADVPNPEESEPPAEETDADMAQQPFPTPGDEHLKPVGTQR